MANVTALASEPDTKPKYVYDHVGFVSLCAHYTVLIRLFFLVFFVFAQFLKSSYYLCQIEDNWTYFMVYELNKQENKAKTMAFVQEICEELNLSKTFQSFNSNIK